MFVCNKYLFLFKFFFDFYELKLYFKIGFKMDIFKMEFYEKSEIGK